MIIFKVKEGKGNTLVTKATVCLMLNHSLIEGSSFCFKLIP